MSKERKKESGSHNTAVVEEMNNNANALSEVRHAANEFLDKIFAMSEERGICSEEAMDAAQEILEGVNIPEEETEEIHQRAKKEGKTFVQVVLELVEFGLAASPRHIKKFREYSEITGIPLNEVFEECLSEYIDCAIEVRLRGMSKQAADA